MTPRPGESSQSVVEPLRIDESYDPILDQTIREKLILPAAKFVPYNLSEPDKVEQSEGQIKVIKELFKNEARCSFCSS